MNNLYQFPVKALPVVRLLFRLYYTAFLAPSIVLAGSGYYKPGLDNFSDAVLSFIPSMRFYCEFINC